MAITNMQFGQSAINVVLNEGQLPAKLSTDANGNTVLVGAAGVTYDLATSVPLLIDERQPNMGMGTAFMTWAAGSGSTSDAARTSKIVYNRTDASAVLSRSPDPANPSVMRITGNGTTAVHYTEAFSPGLDATTVRNIGVWMRAGVRSDGKTHSIARIQLFQDNAGSPNFGAAFVDAFFSVAAEGKWHFHILPATAASGVYGTTTVFIPGTGITYMHIRVSSPGGAGDVGLRTPLPSGDVIEYGPLYLNPKSKSAAIIRFDDNLKSASSGGYLDTLTLWATAFPSGFTGRSGVTIPSGAAINAADLVARFGFKANLGILCRHVGQTGFLSVADLVRLQDEYGWKVCFQSYANPISTSQVGLRLLGPYGYSTICPAGAITAVDANGFTQANHVVIAPEAPANGTQGFPVVFDNAGLPPTITAGTTYWLRYQSATTVSVHATEADSGNNVNKISMVGATAASLIYRYAGSTNDGSAILADFETGRTWMQANGLNGWNYYMPNQSAIDLYVEKALLEVGFDGVFSGGVAQDVFRMGHANMTHVSTTSTLGVTLPVQVGGDYMTTMANIGTDGSSEAKVRDAVRMYVQEGCVFQNIQHQFETTYIRALTYYLDELKFWSDAGLLYVDTVDKVALAASRSKLDNFTMTGFGS